MYRGLTPHKITPMSGVLHTKPDLRVPFNIQIYCSGSVIVDVILPRPNETHSHNSYAAICHSHWLLDSVSRFQILPILSTLVCD